MKDRVSKVISKQLGLKMNVDAVSSILANVLYVVERKKVSVRKAFTYVCRRYGCGKASIEREKLFKLAQQFISNYHMLVYVVERGAKVKRYSHRLLARLFLYKWFVDEGEKVDSRLRKAIRRDVPGVDSLISSIDEPWARVSYPKWLFDRIAKLIGVEEAEKLFSAMNSRVVWVRINTLKMDLDKALHLLEKNGVVFEVDKDVPFLVRVIRSRKPIRTLELFKEGAIVIQDKASVLTVLALRPEPDMLIYDFAAAPGIKTSLVMQLTENRAKIIAMDLSERRLEVMKSLLEKYGVDTTRVELILTDSKKISFPRYADAALVDAPCSSSGAIPKDPAIKVILRDSTIPKKMSEIQKSILLNALRYSERVTYATCSLLPEEGEEVVEYVLSQGVEHRLEDPQIPASRGYKAHPIWDKVRRTYPHIDNSEGFFIANLSK